MFHTILVPLDGSDFAEQALPWAVSIARQTGATLDLVRGHVKSDLIALATHGRGGLMRMLFGSVADQVIRGTGCPALVYRPAP